MTGRQIVVTAPSRLHFGLLRFAQSEGRSYGGVGLMLSTPRVTVRVSQAATWAFAGPGAERAEAVARQLVQSTPELNGTRYSIEIEALPPLHAGLGVGTQLALATGTGIAAACGRGEPGFLASMPQAVGRAKRSAVGSHGFALGGLIYEAGYLPGEQVGELISREAIPDAWRIVLLRHPIAEGISGSDEASAFAQLPPVPADVTCELERLAADEITRGAREADFARFTEAVYQYGILAGKCFAPVQGGPFATREIAQAVERLRELGIRGTGQSSWGPTIYAFCETEAVGHWLLEQCSSDPLLSRAERSMTTPDNVGARTTVDES